MVPGAASALLILMVSGEMTLVEILHRKGPSDEPPTRTALGHPEVDRLVDGQLHDVVGRERQTLLLLEVD